MLKLLEKAKKIHENVILRKKDMNNFEDLDKLKMYFDEETLQDFENKETDNIKEYIRGRIKKMGIFMHTGFQRQKVF